VVKLTHQATQELAVTKPSINREGRFLLLRSVVSNTSLEVETEVVMRSSAKKTKVCNCEGIRITVAELERQNPKIKNGLPFIS
jgi:hypothetical protein